MPQRIRILIVVFALTIPVCGLCQTGFYLSYPCKGGNNDLRKFDPRLGGLCLATSPVVTLTEIASVGNLVNVAGRSMFEMRLTREGHARLRTAVSLTTVTAFIVNDEILFVHDSDDGELHEIIRVYQESNPFEFFRLHSILRSEREKM